MCDIKLTFFFRRYFFLCVVQAILEQEMEDQRKQVSKEQLKTLKEASKVTELETRVKQAEKATEEFRVRIKVDVTYALRLIRGHVHGISQ